MKEGFDKEIDSLLRRRARGGTSVREGIDGSRSPGAVAHLDADELGAFAEGALPTGARLAAASHLADCDECRGVVVGLTRVSGVSAESKKHAASGTVPTVASWRAWLASIFAPRVLRYAAPALALCVVAVVSFVALRSRQGERNASQMARNEERRPAGALKDQAGGGELTTTETANANANVDSLVTQPADNASHNMTAANLSAPPPVGRGHGAGEAPPPAATDAKTDEAPAPPPPDAAKTEGPREAARTASKAAPAEEGESTARTENKEKPERRAEAENDVAFSDQPSQQKRAAQSRANEVQMPDGARNQKRASDNSTSNAAGSSGNDTAAVSPRAADRDSSMAKSAPAPKRGRSSGTLGGQRQEDDEVLRTAETRSAAGHRFRREGGAWVDVNYKSSMASTGVRRGTEGYRALVADLPEIGRIAEQIDGEVVVVIRGRAYRIR